MTTHVFIVDETTFKIHLEYRFAGTGAGEKIIDFNNCCHTKLHQKSEDSLVEMIADVSRIRKGDLIVFYLRQNLQKKILEGKFYGIFKAKQDWSFLDNNDQGQYLKDELVKSLTFRTLIEPYKIYAEGVTEWEALDEIKDIHSPNQMLWSLIYRKLKAKRGNTMITVYESERLCQLIRNKNNRCIMDVNQKKLSFDIVGQKIICRPEPTDEYQGRREEINVLPRLITKFNEKKSFEVHLQAYIVKSIGKQINPDLDRLILADGNIEWIGNEVYCGVGMRKIDVMLSLTKQGQRGLIPIELKSKEADENNIRQLQRYIEWIQQYYIPNRQSDIHPILLAKARNRRNTRTYRRLVESCNQFNERNSELCERLKYIEFDVVDNQLVFEEITYDH